MERIFKYQLGITDMQTIKMPESAKLLTVQMQNEAPVLWALVNPDNVLTDRMIETIGTGNPIHNPGPRKYVATYQAAHLVFHVFEYLGL